MLVTLGAVGVGMVIGARFFRAPPPSDDAGRKAPVSASGEKPGQKMAAPVDPAEENIEQALAEAKREADPVRRQRLVLAALRRWAAVDPDAAAKAVLPWPNGFRLEAAAAVLAGAAQRPDDAVRLGIFFCRQDPGWAPEHGRAVIAALAEAGQFPAAVSFALVGVAEVDGEERNKWLMTAFAGWAQREPQFAALAATDLTDGGMRHEALRIVVSGWRKVSPDAPEKFLASLPLGPERTALAAGLAALPAR